MTQRFKNAINRGDYLYALALLTSIKFILKTAENHFFYDFRMRLPLYSAERELFEKIKEVKEALNQAMSQADYTSALGLLTSLRPFIDRFFDNVFVMVDNEKVRKNRLALLSQVKSLFDKYGHLEKLVVEGK